LLGALAQLAEGLRIGTAVGAGAARYPYKRIAIELRVGEERLCLNAWHPRRANQDGVH